MSKYSAGQDFASPIRRVYEDITKKISTTSSEIKLLKEKEQRESYKDQLKRLDLNLRQSKFKRSARSGSLPVLRYGWKLKNVFCFKRDAIRFLGRGAGLTREGVGCWYWRIMRVGPFRQGAAPLPVVVEVVGSGLRGPVGTGGISCSPSASPWHIYCAIYVRTVIFWWSNLRGSIGTDSKSFDADRALLFGSPHLHGLDLFVEVVRKSIGFRIDLFVLKLKWKSLDMVGDTSTCSMMTC